VISEARYVRAADPSSAEVSVSVGSPGKQGTFGVLLSEEVLQPLHLKKNASPLRL